MLGSLDLYRYIGILLNRILLNRDVALHSLLQLLQGHGMLIVKSTIVKLGVPLYLFSPP